MSDLSECRGCIGLSNEHTCTEFSEFLQLQREFMLRDNCCRCKHKDEEIERLKERLECWPVDKAGNFDKSQGELPQGADGIACRDETIRSLDARIERLKKELESERVYARQRAYQADAYAEQIERLHKACDERERGAYDWMYKYERLQARCEAKDAEIKRLRADNELLSVAAQRADNIEKHRDELLAAIDRIAATDAKPDGDKYQQIAREARRND